MIATWVTLVSLGLWAAMLLAIAVFGAKGVTSGEQFSQRFAVGYGVLSSLVNVPLGFWLGAAREKPGWEHVALLIIVSVVAVVVPLTILLVHHSKGWAFGAMWRAFILLLPHVVAIIAFVLSVPAPTKTG